MPRKRLDWIILTAVVAVIGSLWIGMTEVKAGALITAGKPSRPALGYLAPDFTLNGPDGKPVTLSGHKGRPILLNFWATWCPPCQEETPALVAANQQWGDTIAFIGVDSLEPPVMSPPFIAEFGIKYPIAVDEGGEVTAAYHVVSYPTTFFIDSSGTVVQIDVGPLDAASLQSRLAGLAGR